MCDGIFTSKGKGTGVQDTKFHFLVFHALKYNFQYFTAVVFVGF